MQHRHTVVVFLVTIPKYFTGQATTFTNCENYGQPGLSSTIHCSITGTVGYGIRWFRPNGGSPQEIMACNKANYTACEAVGGIAGYSAVVDSPRGITLTIRSFNVTVDYGYWTCRDGSVGIATSCRKRVLCKLCFSLF